MLDTSLLLQEGLQANQIILPANGIEKMVAYLQLIQTWNHTYNLTSITAQRDMVYLHIIDSLIIAPYLQGMRALDVGSGAGLPGIPLAILQPKRQWVLLDKNGKKTRFMTQAMLELNLKNVEIIHSRCEDYRTSACFDSILSRALGTISSFVATTVHLLAPNGSFLAMKGKYPSEELANLPNRFILQNVTRLNIEGIDAQRHIISIGQSPDSGRS